MSTDSQIEGNPGKRSGSAAPPLPGFPAKTKFCIAYPHKIDIFFLVLFLNKKNKRKDKSRNVIVLQKRYCIE